MIKIQPWITPPVLRLVALSPHHRRQGPMHDHPFFEIGIVLRGRCDWLIGRHRLKLNAGEALLLKPGIRHCEKIPDDEGARIAWLGFELATGAPSWCQRPIALGEDLAEITGCFDAISREHHLAGARSQSRLDLALQTLVLLVDRCAEVSLSRSSAKPTTLNSRQVHTVESAAHYFRLNVQQPLSIAQVAAYHSLCPAHFSSLFRRHHGMTPRDFVRRARLRLAMDSLVEGDASLKEIATQCGFVDAAHFCKSFRKEQRTTPTLFRQRMKKDPFHVERR